MGAGSSQLLDDIVEGTNCKLAIQPFPTHIHIILIRSTNTIEPP